MRLLDKSSISLLDVLYVPSLSINLLSVKKVYLNSVIKGTFDN